MSYRIALVLLTAFAAVALPQQVKDAALPDINGKFKAPAAGYDYTRREVMIPMRDGVRLFTVILVPKDATNAPILLTRTPYNASKRAKRNDSPHLVASVPES